MTTHDQFQSTRRHFLGRNSGLALGSVAAMALAHESSAAGNLEQTHFAAKAKRVIYLTQSGGPSQIELFDYKPNLADLEGTVLPDSVRNGQRLTGMTANQKQIVMGPRARFHRHGLSGAHVGEWLPHIGSVADELCFVKSMYTDYINHAPAMTFMLTGHQLPGLPSMGAWASYGLGSDNRNLPDYIVLVSRMERPSDQPLYEYYWGSGFLPSRYQGVKFRSGSEPVLYLNDPHGVSRGNRRHMLDGLAKLNQLRQKQTGDPEIDTRIRQYEMSYRMQASVPELMDLSQETAATFDQYGPDSRRPGSYAANCILARRLAERGVRFIQLFHPDWDHHKKMTAWCPDRCRDTDQPTAALIRDLKQRGLLDDTLIVWGGEFGRGVVGQGNFSSPEAGRDHHPRCFTYFLAGGGVKSGFSYGQTDDYSYNVVENGVHVHDLQATILHLLGIDHRRLTYRFQGLDMKLTGVEEHHVVQDILA
ncbi:MAG: DUF1501 domain-containing protein [Fuerstiella sp.]